MTEPVTEHSGIASLSMDDLIEFHQSVGWPISELDRRLAAPDGEEGDIALTEDNIKAMAHVVWFLRRAEHPDMTLADVLSLPLGEIMAAVDDGISDGGDTVPLDEGSG